MARHFSRRRGALVAGAAIVLLWAGSPGTRAAAPPAPAPGCPQSADPSRLADVSELLRINAAMAAFGRRPTASRAHTRFVNWIVRRLRALPGVELRSLRYSIDRQLERRARLTVGVTRARRRLALAGPVPYSKPTSRRGVAAPLVYVPEDQPIADADVSGKIVVREAVTGSIRQAIFNALAWSFYDPDLSLLAGQLETYERDYLGAEQRIADIRAAGEAGAAGLILVHGFPRRQVKFHYAPYEGIRWRLPALYVGADEGERLKRLAARGGRARIKLRASRARARTRTVVATLPGASQERIVVESHTDGMNAVWDNGPVAMLAMLEHFARLPRECRPRSLEFAFTTAHLYLHLNPPMRGGGAGEYAAELDRAYDEGSLALVIALEHLGAREYSAVPRPDGGPGRVLEPTGRTEPNSFFTGQSPVLVAAVTEQVIRHDLRRSIVLRGADLPSLELPPHHSFGGEGTAYHNRLLPTVAFVTGPWSLYNPAFGMEALDGNLLHAQTLTFTDLIYALDQVPRELIAGGYLVERQLRELLCGISPNGFGLVDCAP